MKNKGSNLSFLSINLLPLLCPLSPRGLADKGNNLITKLNIDMITNNVLTRKMGDFDVYQRTSDGYFNADSLLKQWNSVDGNEQRKMETFLSASRTKEFMVVLKDEIVKNNLGQICPKIDTQIVKKSRSGSGKAGRPRTEIWMNPLLFLKFAMWINPRFELQVLKFVYDNLIKYRKRAGDAYKEMSTAVYGIIPKNIFRDKIQALAQSLNIIVYGKHETMARNLHGEEKLAEELMNLETDLARMINMGYIRNEEGIRDYLYRVLKMKKQVYF